MGELSAYKMLCTSNATAPLKYWREQSNNYPTLSSLHIFCSTCVRHSCNCDWCNITIFSASKVTATEVVRRGLRAGLVVYTECISAFYACFACFKYPHFEWMLSVIRILLLFYDDFTFVNRSPVPTLHDSTLSCRRPASRATVAQKQKYFNTTSGRTWHSELQRRKGEGARAPRLMSVMMYRYDVQVNSTCELNDVKQSLRRRS